MENSMVFYFLKMISDKFNYICDQVICSLAYYFGELHKRSTMSSSSQISSSESGSSPKLKSTVTDRANELQVVVSYTKETVRFLPLLQEAAAPPTIWVYKSNHSKEIKNYSKNVYSRVADVECQTVYMSAIGDWNNQCIESTIADSDYKNNAPEEEAITADFISNDEQEENEIHDLDHINEKRLTMSSSSQISSSEAGSSPKLKSAVTDRANELQEVVSCTKETVRFSPLLQEAAGPPTIWIYKSNHSEEIKNYLKKVFSRGADEECQQTVDMSAIGYSNNQCIESTIAHSDYENNAPEEEAITADFISDDEQEENEIHDLDHNNVIVTEHPEIENEFAPSVTRDDKLDTNDTVDSRVVINLKIPSKDEEKYKEEKDSCCMNCFLNTLRCCDYICVIM